MWIDPRSMSPHRVLLHEQIHMAHPRWSEARVLAEEARRWARMGWRAKAELLRLFGRAVIGGEE